MTMTLICVGSFNTVNGKYYCLIIFVLPSLRSGTWDVRTSSSRCSSAVSHSAAHTVNGRCCCFITFVLPSLRSGTRDVRTSSSRCSSAVSHPSAHTVNSKCCCNVLLLRIISIQTKKQRFNTVNGRYYYINIASIGYNKTSWLCFNTVNGKHYCPITFVLPSLRSGTWDVRPSSSLCSSAASHPSAHTVNGKDCCNSAVCLKSIAML